LSLDEISKKEKSIPFMKRSSQLASVLVGTS
jgi:hypothetical protein